MREIFVSLATYCGGVFGLFAACGRVFSTDETNRAISSWLKRGEVAPSFSSWGRQFVALFDRVFGKRHFGLKCFFRSCIVSLVIMALLNVRWATLRPDDAMLFWDTSRQDFWDELWFVLRYTVIWNMVSDYTALYACRRVLGIMATRNPSVLGSMVYALAGTLVSIAAYLGVTVYIGLVLIALSGETSVGLPNVNCVFVRYVSELVHNGLYLRSTPPHGSIGVYFYSALFTSIWSWLYFGATFIIRLAGRLAFVLRFMRRYMRLDDRPIECIGAVAAFIAGVVIVLVSLVSAVVG